MPTTAKLFKNGSSQAVRLPRDFAFSGKEVYVRRLGRAVILVPKDEDPWRAVESAIEEFTDDFMEPRVQPPQAQRETL